MYFLPLKVQVRPSTWLGAEFDRSLSFYEKMKPRTGKAFLLLWSDLSHVASINICHTNAGTPALVFHIPLMTWIEFADTLSFSVLFDVRQVMYTLGLPGGEGQGAWNMLASGFWLRSQLNSTLQVPVLGKHNGDRFLHWQVMLRHGFWGSWLSALTEPSDVCDSAR